MFCKKTIGNCWAFPVLKSALPLHDILLMTWRQGDIGHLIRLPWQNVTQTIGTCTTLILTTWWHKELISTFLDVFLDQSVSVISVEREERGFNMQPSDTISLDTRHSSHLFLLFSKICSGSRLLHGMLKFWHNWNICDNDKPRNIIRAGLQDFTMKFIEWRVHIILGHRTGRLFPVCIKPQPHNYTWTQFTRVA